MSENEKPYIRFVSKIKGLEKIEECKPKLATKYIPDWFKNIPPDTSPKGVKTVRICPSFPDFFSSAYVVPMWMDSILNYDKNIDQWNVDCTNELTEWTIHGKPQFLNYTEASVFGNKADFVFKAVSPWYVFTPPGYSVLQLPMFYHFNKEWSVMPGIIDTDIHHEINQQVLYHGDGNDVFIPRGTPFVMYLPYKREDFDLIVRQIDDEEQQAIDLNNLNFKTTHYQGGHYKKLQREQSKKLKEEATVAPL